MAIQAAQPALAAPQVLGDDRVSRYSWYVLALLVCVYSVNWMDRFVLIILLEPIKQDLQISDTALGFLSGFGFAIIYSLAGIPIARWADVGVRRSIIAMGLTLWSVMTMMCGLARTLPQLVMARLGVALGEASCSPPASSLISDYFPAHRRATAFAIYGLGISFGMFAGLTGGGWLNQYFGWRPALVAAGVPGLLLVLLVRFTLREPARGEVDGGGADKHHYSVAETLRLLRRRPSFLWFALGLGLFCFTGNAFEAWTPVYFLRVFHMSSGEVGTWTGLIEGGAGIVGTLGGGLLADYLGARDMRWYLWMPMAGIVAMIPAMLLFLYSGGGAVMLVGYALFVLCGASYLAPMMALTHRLMPLHLRALSSAVLFLIMNLIGSGAGPFTVGVLNDWLTPHFGEVAVRYSLTLVITGAVLGLLCTLLASRRLQRDLQAQGA